MKTKKSLYNKLILTHWTHNEGFEDRWLRRINRETNSQFISDCQRYLICGDEKYMKGIFKNCATRFYYSKNNKLEQIRGNRWNTNGIFTVNLIENFNNLDCDYSLDMFKLEISKIKHVHIYPISDHNVDISNHLKELLNVKTVLYLADNIGNINTTHETNLISNSSIHYHITIYNENKEIISSKEDEKNNTISFWKFGDTVIFKRESGIGSW